jgi:hypothetical protein
VPDLELPSIVPLPPVATAALPWDRELADPVAELAAARAECGDTFVVDGPEQRTLFLFSPEGVRSFYELAEADASKGVADWMMLRRKLPDELFDGRRKLPHELFGRDDVRTYLAELAAMANVETLVTVTIRERVASGTAPHIGARRAPHLPGGTGRADRDPAPADQHDGAPRSRGLRPRPLGPASPEGRTGAGCARAGDDVRSRCAHLPRATVLAGGDVSRRGTSGRDLRPRTGPRVHPHRAARGADRRRRAQ